MQTSEQGAMRRHIVRCAAEREFHGAWMVGELARNDIAVTSAMLYSMLRRMEAEGVLVSERREVEGRNRRMYRASDATLAELTEDRRALAEAIREVLSAT